MPGLKVNDYLEVRHVTGSMKDPQGNDIEMDERVETVVLTDVQERFSVAKTAVAGLPRPRSATSSSTSRLPPLRRRAPRPVLRLPGVPAPVQKKQ